MHTPQPPRVSSGHPLHVNINSTTQDVQVDENPKMRTPPCHIQRQDQKIGNMMGNSAQNWVAAKCPRTKIYSTMHYFQHSPFYQIPPARRSHTAGSHMISNQVGTRTVASFVRPTCFFGSKLLILGWCLHRGVLVHYSFPRVFNSITHLAAFFKCS